MDEGSGKYITSGFLKDHIEKCAKRCKRMKKRSTCDEKG
jgi:hypothetical protein